MAHWFEDLTKTLGDDKIGRRTAMRRVAGTLVGAAFASAIPEAALAGDLHCPSGGTCNSFFTNCLGVRNTNCFCFQKLGRIPKGFCGCNSYCAQVPPCSSSQKCAKGTSCAVLTGCNCVSSAGLCIPNCKGKNKNCVLGSGHGATAAR